MVEWRKHYATGMIVFVIVSKVFFILQIAEIFRRQSSQAVSLAAYIFTVCSGFLWLFYAAFVLHRPNYPLLLNNILSVFLGAITIMSIEAFRT